MKVEVHTIRYGNPDWLRVCSPTLDQWTDRHGYQLCIWTMVDKSPEYPCLKFCEIDMWRQFLDGDSDWCMYVDGDIYVRSDAPALDFLETGMYVPRSPTKVNGRFAWWCRKYGVPQKRIERLKKIWWFRNMGWWVLDREAAKTLLQVAAPPYIEATMEECQANYWMATAKRRHGLKVQSPPRGWVNFYWLKNPSWMWHLARQHGKMEALRQIQAKGKV